MLSIGAFAYLALNFNQNNGVDNSAIEKQSGLCASDSPREIPSPKGAKILRIHTSSCGGFSGDQTAIVIFDVFTKKKYSGIFGVSGNTENINFEWQGDEILIISGFRLNRLLWFRQDTFSGVAISMRPAT